MGFWNYIGLASKSDVENIHMQLKEVNKLINVCIEASNRAIIKSNELEKNIANSFNSIESKLDIISNDIEEKIKKVDSNNSLINEKILK